MKFRIEKLTETNFSDYEKLTSCESGGGCYCSFWHQKITAIQEWDDRKKNNPQLNRQIVLDKVRTGYHVGVLVYQEGKLVAWISVGPIIDFYWCWKRVSHIGEEAKFIAGIMCFTVAPEYRNRGLQSQILEELKIYGKNQGWKCIEGYPFDASTVGTHKDNVLWPGMLKGFEQAGFVKSGPHWLSQADWERSIYRFETE